MIDDLLSPMHLVVLGVVALLIFGPKRLPEIGRGFGKAIREYKEAVRGLPTLMTQDSSRKTVESEVPLSRDASASTTHDEGVPTSQEGSHQ